LLKLDPGRPPMARGPAGRTPEAGWFLSSTGNWYFISLMSTDTLVSICIYIYRLYQCIYIYVSLYIYNDIYISIGADFCFFFPTLHMFQVSLKHPQTMFLNFLETTRWRGAGKGH
jgi:hypothetical protein